MVGDVNKALDQNPTAVQHHWNHGLEDGQILAVLRQQDAF